MFSKIRDKEILPICSRMIRMSLAVTMLFKLFSLGIVVFLLLTNIWLIHRQLNTSQCVIDKIYNQDYISNPQDPQKRTKKHTGEIHKSKAEDNLNKYESEKPSNAAFNISFDLGRWDNSRLFKIYDFVSVGKDFVEVSQKFSVCLATQSSIEKLHSLAEVSQHWSGPISVALYAAGDDEYYLLHWYVEHLRKCFSGVDERVAFHLALPRAKMPTGRVPDNMKKLKSAENYKCGDHRNILREILKFRSAETAKWRTRVPYPQNHLRNLARKNCQDENVFLTDIDIIPSWKMAENLDVFLKSPHKKCTEKCAYVIPTYELDDRTDFPKDKSDLIRLSQKGLARPFHHKVFIYNQFATNFSRWEAIRDVKGDKVFISHDVTNFEFLYEPFYVAPDTVPEHDERFLGYGYTRNTQVYETFVAGYQFLVLSPVFTIHWGLQGRKGRPPWRERQNSLNRQKFEVFKREVYARYKRDPLKMMH